jgi:hypothetical protein
VHAAPSPLRRCLFAVVGLLTTLSTLIVVGGFVGAPAASAAASAPAATQCDPPAFPTGAGFEASCTVTIHNTVSAAGAVSSTVTATSCLAAAGVLPPFGCTTTVTSSNQLVTSVNQCNNIVDGGGSHVTCSVSVVNTIPAGRATAGVTVNQCIGSGNGGGTQPTVVCAPVASTTNATVTQCDGSANGGGASTRVQCNVTGASTAEPVTINQCNGSSNGGGSTVTCFTTFTNNFITTAPGTTPTTPTTPATPTGPAAPTTGATAPSGTGGTTGSGATTAPGKSAPAAPGKGAPAAPGAGRSGSAGSGVTGKSGSAKGAGGSTGTSAAIGTLGFVPFGAPQTGLGGASHSTRDSDLLIPGALAVIAGAFVIAFALRRRHGLLREGSDEVS